MTPIWRPIPRRRFLALMKGVLASTTILGSGVLARAQQPSKSSGTNKNALPGKASEQGPEYALVSKFATYDLGLEYGVDKHHKLDPASDVAAAGNFRFRCRTWAMDGMVDDNYLGPALEMRPGETVRIKIINRLNEVGIYKNIGPAEPKPKDWYPMIDQDKGRYAFFHKHYPVLFPFANTCKPPPRPGLPPVGHFIVDEVNIPKNYNWTNLHTHGLQVQPHLFEPQGTLDPKADYITIKPDEEKTYTFKLEEDHPCGTFWYHPHRHNSVAIQAWSGMAGLIFVRGKYDEELKSFGVTREIPFVVHDPHYTVDKAPQKGRPGSARVGRFLANQTDADDYTFMVTGQYRPQHTVKRNEVVLLRHLTATVENLSAFRIVKRRGTGKPAPPKTDDGNVPFWIIASDGIAYPKPVKRTTMVCGGGERHDILMQLPQPGLYEIWSDHCEAIQFFGTGPKDQLLATFRVTEEAASGQAPISGMTFTPGVAPDRNIMEGELVRRRHFVFDIATDTCRIPFPQMKINDRDYRPEESAFDVKAGTAEEWIITNPSLAVHPFHIHVNPFQVKEIFSAFTVDEVPVPKTQRGIVTSRIEAMRHVDRPNMWRDSVIVPPQGALRVWMRFDPRWTGKTVFHCHFLAHEETGMIQNFRIVP